MLVLFVEKFPSDTSSQLGDGPFILVSAADADEAMSLLRHGRYDVIVVQAAGDWQDLIVRLRASGNDRPVLVLGAAGGGAVQAALDRGATEVLVEPVAPVVLQERVCELIRRGREAGGRALQLGELTLCLETREARLRGQALRLTPKEFAMLELMVLRRGEVLPRAAFLDHLYPDGDWPDGPVTDVVMCKLRRKLARGGAGRLVSIVRGRGHGISELDALRQRVSDIMAEGASGSHCL